MTMKKKPASKLGPGKKTGRLLETPQMRRRPEHSAAYEATLKDYTAALELVHRGDYAAALERFRSVEKAAAEEPELAERARTYAALCTRRLAPSAPRPETAEGCYHLGVVRTNEGKLDEAVSLFDAALRLEPGSSRVLYARASARALQGATAAAVADLRQAVAADPRLRYQAANDPDFEKIRDEAAFIDVIEPTPTGA